MVEHGLVWQLTICAQNRTGMANQILEAKEKEREKEAETAAKARLKEEEEKTKKRRRWAAISHN